MGTICLQCGDKGFDNALVYCVKCLDFAVHRYCLDVIPETLDEFVLWVCDDCVVDGENPLATYKHDPIPCQATDHAVHEGTKEDIDVKHVTTACAADERKICRESSSQQLEGEKANDKLVHCAANSLDEIFLRGIVKKKKRRQQHSKPSEQPVISCNGFSESSNEKEIVMSAEVILLDYHSENKELPLENHRELEERDERTSTLENVIDLCKDFPDVSNISAEPVVMPIWSGSFNIWNKKNDILGLVAHMSSKACRRVYETACQFEPVLHLEMLPKSDVWPKSFQTSEPSDDNIALYFFPSEASERVFDRLVKDMTEMELAMKALMQNAELLIFTSSELPLRYWRFRGEYYLWGVFRGRQNPPQHGDNPIRQQADTSNVPTEMKVKCDDDAPRTPLSPLSNASSYGSGTF